MSLKVIPSHDRNIIFQALGPADKIVCNVNKRKEARHQRHRSKSQLPPRSIGSLWLQNPSKRNKEETSFL